MELSAKLGGASPCFFYGELDFPSSQAGAHLHNMGRLVTGGGSNRWSASLRNSEMKGNKILTRNKGTLESRRISQLL